MRARVVLSVLGPVKATLKSKSARLVSMLPNQEGLGFNPKRYEDFLDLVK